MQTFIPLAFSKDRLAFEHDPSDDQLTALLGSKLFSTGLAIRRTPELLTARVQAFPVKGIAALALTLWGGIGVFMYRHHLFDGPLTYLIFLGSVPTFLYIMFAVNKQVVSQPDFFQVDLIHHRLILPALGLTIDGSQIESFVELDRYHYYKNSNRWAPLFQIGVLVRGSAGRFEYFPVAKSECRPKIRGGKTATDELGQIFGVYVRQVKRTWKESRQIND